MKPSEVWHTCVGKVMMFVVLAITVASSCTTNHGSSAESGCKVIVDTLDCIVSDTTFHNLGTIEYSDIVSVSNTLTNRCQKEIYIVDVSTDCGCLSASYDSEMIEPGGSTKVYFEFDTRGVPGSQYHLASISTSNGQTIKVCFHAKVLEPKH